VYATTLFKILYWHWTRGRSSHTSFSTPPLGWPFPPVQVWVHPYSSSLLQDHGLKTRLIPKNYLWLSANQVFLVEPKMYIRLHRHKTLLEPLFLWVHLHWCSNRPAPGPSLCFYWLHYEVQKILLDLICTRPMEEILLMAVFASLLSFVSSLVLWGVQHINIRQSITLLTQHYFDYFSKWIAFALLHVHRSPCHRATRPWLLILQGRASF